MRLLFLFIGEPHHLFHALPIAAELQRADPACEIEIAITGDRHAHQVERVLEAFPGMSLHLHRLKQPFRWHALRNTAIGRSELRVPTLFANLRYLRSFDAIVAPERTTTVIKPFLSQRTKLIFTPHGAGDRAIMLDPRDARFDFVLVAGEKSERRLLDAGTIRPGDYAVPGYVKLDLMRRLSTGTRRSFDNDRPTVLYAPHFRSSLSSWDDYAKPVIEAFRHQDRFNLIVAPHIRLFNSATHAEKARWQGLAEPGKIIIDLGSSKLTDMSYTSEADIYLGDVSSQVYEYLARPRPCVFINAHDVQWRNNPDYLFWTLGDVVDDPAELIATIAQASQRHPLFAAAQEAAVADSCGAELDGAAERSAMAIRSFLLRNRPQSRSPVHERPGTAMPVALDA